MSKYIFNPRTAYSLEQDELAQGRFERRVLVALTVLLSAAFIAAAVYEALR